LKDGETSRELGGPDLLIKRDDQTGLALGGKKWKLESVGQALEQGANLVTAGAAPSMLPSNRRRRRQSGFEMRTDLNGMKPDLPNGNLLLDELLRRGRGLSARNVRRAATFGALRAQGRKPYVIPVGGSNGVGAAGYVGMMELADQLLAARQQAPHRVWVQPGNAGGWFWCSDLRFLTTRLSIDRRART
jgi:D-cysteine desulfhydrase